MTLSRLDDVLLCDHQRSKKFRVNSTRLPMRLSLHAASSSAVCSALVASFMIASVTTLQAQRRPYSEITGRMSASGHLQVSEPRGDFGANTANGFGLGGTALFRLDPSGLVNFRVDGGFLTYGNSTRRIPLSGTGGLVKLNLRTSNNIATVVAGPQLLGPSGVFTPYASILGGISVFWTESSIEGSNNDNTPFASTTNASDAVLAYGGAVGAYLRVYNGERPLRLDFGARYLRHDNVKYLNDKRVRDAFEQNRDPIPVRSRADFLTYYVGVNVIVF